MAFTSGETYRSPTPQDRIVKFADRLLEGNTDTTKQYSNHMKSALFFIGVDDTGKQYPTLKVTIPLLSSHDHLAMFEFGNQNPKLSWGALLGKDGTVRVSGFDGNPSKFIPNQEIEDFAQLLEGLESSLIPEVQI